MDISATPVEVTKLLDYQPGAVVSRTLVDTPEGTVTVFAFDRDQGLSEHTAPFDALVTVIEGAAEITISGRPQRVGAGQIILMPAREPHALRAIEAFKMLLVMIRSGSSG